MTAPANFVMAGGHTGGHITPALAVARVLREHGHSPVFIGTQRGLEAKLVPSAGFPIEWIEVGGIKGAGLSKRLSSLKQLPMAVRLALKYLDRYTPRAIFSMGGFVAAPVVVAAILKRLPLVVMEPNAMPGAANRYAGRFVAKALLSFSEAARYFPKGRTELSGMPVRAEFFQLPRKSVGDHLNILITGGSQGARSLNQAAQETWQLFESARIPVRIVHQTGPSQHSEVLRAFEQTNLEGDIVPFITDMPAAFAEADLIISRSGAGTVSELAAAGKASILVPYPFAADQHQLKNAQALAKAGAARLLLDQELTGERLFGEVRSLYELPAYLEKLGEAVRQFAKPNAASRAAEILEEYA